MAKTLKQLELKKQYNFVCMQYIQKFCNKEKVEFDFWVGNTVGEVACFSTDIYLDFKDIVHHINTNQPKGLIFSWYYARIENHPKDMNYFSYTKGLRFDEIDYPSECRHHFVPSTQYNGAQMCDKCFEYKK